jgi:cytochrome c oxidase subunit II
MQLHEASSWAKDWQDLFYFLIAISVFFSVLIFGLILYFGIRYRRRSKDEVPPATVDNRALEITWIVIPSGLCIIIFMWASSLYFRNVVPPTASTEIFVVGKQWMWKVQHLEGIREINELHVPVGVPIKLTMTSEDVIHDFSVPSFRIKKDVLPGAYTTEWFTATEAGRFHLYCDQYCGTNHSAMTGWVTVMTKADYARWLSYGLASLADATSAGPRTSGRAGAVESMADEGARLYERYGCNTCHSTGKGPSLAGLYGSRVKLSGGRLVTADNAYIRDSILTPSARVVDGYQTIMPTFQGQLDEGEILALTAYIHSLAEPERAARQVVIQ